MKDLIKTFHKRLLTEISRLQFWSEEEDIIDKLRDDLKDTDFMNTIPCMHNMTFKDCFEQYFCVCSKPNRFSYSIVYLFQNIGFQANSFGGISRDQDQKLIYINLFKLFSVQQDFKFKFGIIKDTTEKLFSHLIINTELHHEVAHYYFSKRFKTYNDYLKYVEVDSMKQDASEEEYNSYLQEFQAWIKNLQIQNKSIRIPDTYDEAMNLLDSPEHKNPYTQNLKQHLQLFPEERVDKDLRKILRKVKFGESYENLFSDLVIPGFKGDPLPGEIFVDPKKVKPLPADHPLRKIKFHTIDDEDMKGILEMAKQIDKLGWLKEK